MLGLRGPGVLGTVLPMRDIFAGLMGLVFSIPLTVVVAAIVLLIAVPLLVATALFGLVTLYLGIAITIKEVLMD